MSFLGNFISKAATTVNTLSPAKRWLALALLVLLAFSLVVLCKPSATQYVNLYQGRRFSSAELAQIEQAFSNAGLNEWQIQDSQVTVPHPQKSSYLKALENVIESDTLNVDMDVALKNSSLWEPRHVKDLKIKHAKEKQLARMLASMKFIEDVTVRIDEIETKGLRGGRKTTALAAVKPTDDQQLDRHRAYAIRNAVAACYASLDLEQVTVLDLNSGRVFGRQQTANSEAEDPYTVRKRHFEQLFQDRIREELSAEIPGVSVEIHVALNYANQSATAPVATSVTAEKISANFCRTCG
ncbi:MAG TPA: hypothetical protein EYN70_12790 [Planctomycetaceae bacterium]|nr:hypothetical protein [Planctomycetaceae bacterium]